MKLPMQETPEYKVTLPVTKQEVTYRPFLVKEQKNLILAREGKSAKEIFEAIEGLLKSVTKEQISGKNLPLADLEYLFLQIRCKSIGETSKLELPCVNSDCEVSQPLSIDLTKIEVEQDDVPENKFSISDDIMIEMDYPTTELVSQVEELEESKAVKPILRSCMVRIYDSEEIYELKDFPDREIDKFIDNMTIDQFEKVMVFFNKVPTLRKEFDWKCKKCGAENSFVAQGLQSFF